MVELMWLSPSWNQIKGWMCLWPFLFQLYLGVVLAAVVIVTGIFSYYQVYSVLSYYSMLEIVKLIEQFFRLLNFQELQVIVGSNIRYHNQ